MSADLEMLRRRAFAVAYRMLGSVADAEDVVQEALLRFTRSEDEVAAFLLRDVFDYDYPRIAGVIGHSEANSRQLVTRARKHLAANQPRFEPDGALRHELLERFLAAAEEGDTETLEQLLADGATLYGDGGGKVTAVRVPIVGAAAIAAFMAEITRQRQELGEFTLELVEVNGQPGRILRTPAGDVWDVLSVDVVDGRIATIRIVRNPDKLGHIG